MRRTTLAVAAALALTITGIAGPAAADSHAVKAEPGQDVNMLLLPKFLGIIVFDQANQGAQEAATELGMPTAPTFTGPTAENSVAGQIEQVTNAPTQGFDVVMLSNNAGDQIAPVAAAAQEADTKVVTWDSPIPSAEGESVFVAQVDFTEMGRTMADMALSLVGEDGGQVAILSATPDAANQNSWIEAYEEAIAADPDKYGGIENVETVFGDDQSEKSYNAAIALADKWPDLEVIMAPTTVGIAAAAKAMQDEDLCDEIAVSGLGLPSEMVDFTMNGCAPEFALWSFVDLGYLTTYVSYLLATGAIEGVEGEAFEIGRPIFDQTVFTIEKDPTRPDVDALRVLMGPFTVYTPENVEAAAG
jgi:rhamnose transport system substrate-binding protein